MASACRVLSSVRKRYAGRFNFLALPSSSHHLNFHKESSSNPLLIKLLRVSNSCIKPTLDQELASLKSSEFSWESLVSCLRPSSPEKSRLVLEWILEKLLKDNERNHSAFSEFIFLCAKLQNVSLAMQAFASMEANGVKPTSLVFNSLINACLCSHNIITAFSLFEIMESSESYEPDFHTYNIFITAFSISGNVDAMLAWYSAKRAAGFGLDLQTFESLVSGCIKSNNFELADGIYEEMRASGIIPSISILENMLEGLCKQKSLGRAEEFFKFVASVRWEINENMTDKLMALYQEFGQVKKMEELLETMKSHPINDVVLSRIHCGIIGMYAKLDRLDDVEFAVGRMLKQGLSFTSIDDVEKVICSYFRREAYDRLDIFLECIETSYTPSRSTYDLLISGYRRAGLHEKVDSITEAMKSAGVT
ncbi:pentatricopeptide repeat-containing protein At2g35130-like [Prosopis cineraria]|uniref:pentatricopeptide repeat-containing protein At2g35130-like n=1 Tax=Prosopis cineraria TaxID=364024 RepID=UPI0024102AE0|nr:pentatricopeptide repeat-containing protein At2g35130-like [Prosopis cineraria]